MLKNDVWHQNTPHLACSYALILLIFLLSITYRLLERHERGRFLVPNVLFRPFLPVFY